MTTWVPKAGKYQFCTLFKENYVLETYVWVLVISGRAQVFDNLCVLVLLARGAFSIFHVQENYVPTATQE